MEKIKTIDVEELFNYELLQEYRNAVMRLRTETQTHETILMYADLHNEIMRRMEVTGK